MKLLPPKRLAEIRELHVKQKVYYENNIGPEHLAAFNTTEALLDHITALEAELEPHECEWKLTNDYYCDVWDSSCGESWSFTEGGIEENRVRYCQGCGGKVKQTPLKQE